MTLVRICNFRYFFALVDFLHYDSPVEIDEPGFRSMKNRQLPLNCVL
jgi:hypothetical protein